MIPGGVGYSDAPTFGGFGSKSPCSEHAMELGDMEAAFLGNIAYYCIKLGTIPPISLKPFWFIGGQCHGLRCLGHDEDELDMWGEHSGYDYLAPLYPVVDHLVRYAPFILGTEGIEELLKAGEETRWYSQKMFPNETDEWVTEKWAIEHIGRTDRTLREWRKAGIVAFIPTDEGTLYRKEDLLVIKQVKDGNRKRGVKLGA